LLLSLCAYLTVSFAAMVLATLVVNGRIDPSQFRNAENFTAVTQSPLGMVIIMVIPQLALVAPAILAALASPVGLRQRLNLVRGNWPIWLWITAALATPLIGLISSAVVSSLLGESRSLDEMAGIFRSLGQGGFLIPLALLVGITPGICEELLFRGYVQTRLTAAWGALLGILSTSALFSIFHLDLVHAVAVMALGVYLGWIAWSSRSTLPAILAHFFNNFLSVLAVVLLPESVSDSVTSGDVENIELPAMAAATISSVMLMSGICLVVTLYQAARRRRGIAAHTTVPAAEVSDSDGRILPS
jgi:uncharacterized protein